MKTATTPPQDERSPIEIVFGMPSRNCERAGICRVEFADQAWSSDCSSCAGRGVRVDLRYAPGMNRLGLEIPLSELTDLLWEQQFSRGFFEVIEAYELEAPLCNYLGSRARLRIKPGRYPFVFTTVSLFLHLAVQKIRPTINLTNHEGHYFFPALLETPKFNFI